MELGSEDFKKDELGLPAARWKASNVFPSHWLLPKAASMPCRVSLALLRTNYATLVHVQVQRAGSFLLPVALGAHEASHLRLTGLSVSPGLSWGHHPLTLGAPRCPQTFISCIAGTFSVTLLMCMLIVDSDPKAELHCTALHCITLHCTAPHCITLHGTAQYCEGRDLVLFLKVCRAPGLQLASQKRLPIK